MKLAELQLLPHKWWKSNQPYIPCTKDIPIDIEPFYATVKVNPKELLDNVIALETLELYRNINPTRYDWFYAINTELAEYIEHPSEEELADIAIFCAMYLRIYHDTNLYSLIPTAITTVEIAPVYSDSQIRHSIIDLLIWAITSTKIIEKIEYNKIRSDHVTFRHRNF